MAPELSGSTPWVVVVTLGKGGVGKTTTTANLAQEQRTEGEAPGGEAGGARASSRAWPAARAPRRAPWSCSIPPPPPRPSPSRPTRCHVGEANASCIIGKTGSVVHAMEARSGAHIKISVRGRPLPGTDRRVVFVCGIFRAIMGATDPHPREALLLGNQVIDAEATVVLVVPDACCGALIGKGGEVIKSLAEESNTGITVSPYNIFYGFHDRVVSELL